jgi:hypothetical protein
VGKVFKGKLKGKKFFSLLFLLGVGVLLVGLYFYSKNGSFFNLFPRASGGASWNCSWVWSSSKRKYIYKCQKVTPQTVKATPAPGSLIGKCTGNEHLVIDEGTASFGIGHCELNK